MKAVFFIGGVLALAGLVLFIQHQTVADFANLFVE